MQYTPGCVKLLAFSREISPAYHKSTFLLACYPGSSFNVVRVAPLGDPFISETRHWPGLVLPQKILALLEVEAVSLLCGDNNNEKLTIVGDPNSGRQR